MTPSILRQTSQVAPRPSTMQAPPMQAPARRRVGGPPTAPQTTIGMPPRGALPRPPDTTGFELPASLPSPPQPDMELYTGQGEFPHRRVGQTPQAVGPEPSPAPSMPPSSPSVPPSGGFQPSGNPLADVERLYQGAATNYEFLALLEQMKAAYPGRVSDVGASAKGVWDKIVIDGQAYDLIEAAGGPRARWMKPLAEGGGGGMMPLGGSLFGAGGGMGGVPQPLEQGAGTQAPDRNRVAEMVAAMMGNTLPPQYDWMRELQQQQEQQRAAMPKMERPDPMRFFR